MSEYEEHSGDEIRCPYCGIVNTDSWEHDRERTYECESCWIPSKLEVDTAITYTTTPSAKLIQDEIEDLERRLQGGAVWPSERIARLKAVIATLEEAER